MRIEEGGSAAHRARLVTPSAPCPCVQAACVLTVLPNLSVLLTCAPAPKSTLTAPKWPFLTAALSGDSLKVCCSDENRTQGLRWQGTHLIGEARHPRFLPRRSNYPGEVEISGLVLDENAEMLHVATGHRIVDLLARDLLKCRETGGAR